MRITRVHLDAKLATIARMTHTPETPYSHVDGKFSANVGAYIIDSNSPGDRYGTRYSLSQIVSESGGQSTIIPTVCGGENFADALSAFIRGIEIGATIKS